jgi:hypothetical protein
MTKLQLNSQQTVKSQKKIAARPAIMFSIAANTQGGPSKINGAHKNVK